MDSLSTFLLEPLSVYPTKITSNVEKYLKGLKTEWIFSRAWTRLEITLARNKGNDNNISFSPFPDNKGGKERPFNQQNDQIYLFLRYLCWNLALIFFRNWNVEYFQSKRVGGLLRNMGITFQTYFDLVITNLLGYAEQVPSIFLNLLYSTDN